MGTTTRTTTRTTIRIDEALHRSVKAEAARSGRTVSDVIEDAVRMAFLAARTDSADVPDLPVFGNLGAHPGVDVSDLRSVIDDLDDLDRSVRGGGIIADSMATSSRPASTDALR